MSSPRRNFWLAFFPLGTLAIAASTAVSACSQATTPPADQEEQSAALDISPGVSISSATWWLTAPGGTTVIGTGPVAVGKSDNVQVTPSPIVVGTTYQLI